MTTATVQIAQHLNIVESLIVEVQEWAHVLFVRFTTGRPRFVSKKVVKVMQGTEKQVKWALDLQQQVVVSLDRHKKVAESELSRYQQRLAKTNGTGSKAEARLVTKIKELQRFLDAVDSKIEAVKNCQSAKAFIETRPNPSTGAERQWARLIQEVEAVLNGDTEAIRLLSQPQYAISRLGEYEAIVLGYDYERYVEQLKVGQGY